MPVRSRRRQAGWAAAVVALLVTVWFTVLQPGAQAQAPEEQPAAKADTPAQEGDAADKPEAPAPPKQRLFTHIVSSAGIFFGPLLLLISIGLVALIVLLSMDLRMIVAIPPTFVDEFTETVNKRKFREAFDLAREDHSFLARVLTAGMARLQYGIEDARETAEHTVDSLRAGKEQLITYLATVGSLGPMLGLVGTVYGMILSFMELSQPGKTPNPQKLAEGISHALVVTLLGVALAVPAIFFHAFFRNRLVRISMDAANVADDLLTQMYHNSKRTSAATAADVRMAAPFKTAEG